ncbi:hypothetical protein OGAPHI_000923 [Ogataea philodendri]|uniref:Golgi apyrase n=1 Tax=Ogataea philodendri TaxID=1378263 RepID=A0A9P8PDS7_9ASCO|nr:uncharacterized protein OGAPHI_000923 [Ogataea philodendri]KAH3670408.1 hypothetical protein OGAPHI_000923 [Ogataea philodendri]
MMESASGYAVPVTKGVKTSGAMPIGEIVDANGIPYNYLVVVDAGSKGSRAYVYYWTSTQYLLANNQLQVADNSVRLLSRVEEDPSDLPSIQTGEKWYKKLKPGISEFRENSAHIGPKYLVYLLKKVHDIIPIEQHYRTPIFVHATAGMRLLMPNEQNEILQNICEYLQRESSLYIPDCQSHVNVIDGDVEGLYGWIALNYLTGSFSKRKQTAGLLDMGGASTQISFEPNEKEQKEHSNQLINLKLATLGQQTPDLAYNVHSNSFLGYGFSQIRLKFLRTLETKVDQEKEYLLDPCFPAKRHQTLELDGIEKHVEGTGNYEECSEKIYQLIANKCVNHEDVSACLLSDQLPEFSFSDSHFYGVSGYWDTISKLLSYNQNEEDYGKIYAYDQMAQATQKVCSSSWKVLKEYKGMSKQELEELCFKSTYLTTLLHNGFGLNKNQSDFHVNDKVNGSAFTWTLGRAVLYASDESLIEVQNFANDFVDNGKRSKVGYSHNSAPGVFVRGSENDGVPLRPAFERFESYEPPGFLKDMKQGLNYDGDVAGEIDHKPFAKEHPWVIVAIVFFVLILGMVNKSRILRLVSELVHFVTSVTQRCVYGRKGPIHWPFVTRRWYKRARSMDLDLGPVELDQIDPVDHEEEDFDWDVEDGDVLSGYEDFELSEESDDGIEHARAILVDGVDIRNPILVSTPAVAMVLNNVSDTLHWGELVVVHAVELPAEPVRFVDDIVEHDVWVVLGRLWLGQLLLGSLDGVLQARTSNLRMAFAFEFFSRYRSWIGSLSLAYSVRLSSSVPNRSFFVDRESSIKNVIYSHLSDKVNPSFGSAYSLSRVTMASSLKTHLWCWMPNTPDCAECLWWSCCFGLSLLLDTWCTYITETWSSCGMLVSSSRRTDNSNSMLL